MFEMSSCVGLTKNIMPIVLEGRSEACSVVGERRRYNGKPFGCRKGKMAGV
jgi:hypothetical protein